jgi:uncharacterized cupredoxin-like copper-binding protein
MSERDPARWDRRRRAPRDRTGAGGTGEAGTKIDRAGTERLEHGSLESMRLEHGHPKRGHDRLGGIASRPGRGLLLRAVMAGAIALAAAPGPSFAATAADPWANPQIVTVVMVDNRFQPDQIILGSGQPYELRLQNRGKELHEFTAPAFFRNAVVRDPKQLTNGGTDIVVQPGASVNVVLRPLKPGQYRLICADHDWDGMVGSITVN